MLSFYLAVLDDPEDQQVFLRFYQEHKRLMLKVAFNILRDQHLAEDAVHDAFVDMLDMIEKLRELGDGQAKGFAIVIARNKAVDIYRKRKASESWEELTEDSLTMEMEFDESNRIFNELPYCYSEVIKLLGLRFKPAEIARILNRDVHTVYKQIGRGKKILGKIMEKEGYHVH